MVLFGATAMPGRATDATVAAYGPVLKYMRDFGRDQDGDRLPELPPHGAGKWLQKPTNCLLHVSWKDDVEELTAWLDGLAEDVWLSVWHEQHGDPGTSPAGYRTAAARMVEIIRAHPNGHHVVGNGPIVTRYWLVQKGGDPLAYWYEGATFFGVDVYADGPDDKAGYRLAAALFGEGFARVRAAIPGVRLVLPEYGLGLRADDPSGVARAAAMREHAAWLRAQPDVLAVGWWDIGGCRITGREPEQSTWRRILEESDMRITWLADVLRAAGLEVVEHDGWQSRRVAGDWEPRYGIVHATAAPRSQPDDVQVRVVRDGRSDLDGPIAVACVDRRGRWHVLAAGRCNTTIVGTAGPYKGMGNSSALGVEACNDNRSEPWPDVQYRAYVQGWAAIARRLGWQPERLRGHKEHTPGHKTDPSFDMGQFRRDVAAVLAGEDDDMPISDADVARIARAVHNQPLGASADTVGVGIQTTLGLVRSLPATLAAIRAAVDADQVDEQAIAAAVVVGLDPEALAARIVELLPAEQAQATADAVVSRLADALAG